MRILIETIPHHTQRYPTCGDWWFERCPIYKETQPPGNREVVGYETEIHIRVSELGDWKKEALVAFHELAEVLACRSAGVTQEEVDQFDMKFEETRKEGDESEPGDHPSAPYYRQHIIATACERLLAGEMQVNWDDYEAKINSLFDEGN